MKDKDSIERIPVHVKDGINQRKTKTLSLNLRSDLDSKLVAQTVATQFFGYGLENDDGTPYDYRFIYEGRLLTPDETLTEASVAAESTLLLTYNPSSAGLLP